MCLIVAQITQNFIIITCTNQYVDYKCGKVITEINKIVKHCFL
jgi:hypothetical protein